MKSEVTGLFLGRIENRWEGRPPSAIGKIAVDGRQSIEAFGFSEDAQADLKHHGGADKAIHHYATDHYATWMSEGAMPQGTVPAAFGENIATKGMTETTVCIGDIFRLGSALVQVSQGRQPCWKLGAHTGNARMPLLFTRSGRTGWYYRVLETGSTAPGDSIELTERPQPDWTVHRVTAARLLRKASQQECAALAALPELAEGWRAAFSKMAGGDYHEDTATRLQG